MVTACFLLFHLLSHFLSHLLYHFLSRFLYHFLSRSLFLLVFTPDSSLCSLSIKLFFLLFFFFSFCFSKIVKVKIIDDEEYEKNKAFFIEIGEPRLVEISEQKGGGTLP